MKLKKAESADVPEMLAPIPGMELGAVPPAGNGSSNGGVGAMIAVFGAVGAIALLGLVTWMIYSHIAYLENV